MNTKAAVQGMYGKGKSKLTYIVIYLVDVGDVRSVKTFSWYRKLKQVVMRAVKIMCLAGPVPRNTFKFTLQG